MNEEKNTLLIVGVVLSVLLPPIGLIICLICLNDIKKNNKSGKNLATNGIMVSILMIIVLTIGTTVLVIHHNKEEERHEQREKYERELKKVYNTLPEVVLPILLSPTIIVIPSRAKLASAIRPTFVILKCIFFLRCYQ